MGGLIQVKEKEFAVWTGGKPLAGWTGLDGITMHQTPQQMRFYKDDTGYNARCAGLDKGFDRTGDLSKLQRQFIENMETRGLDTIIYLQDPGDPTIMINVISDHTRFTFDSVKMAAPAQKGRYDQYDLANDKAARTALLNSLSISLQDEVEERVQSSFTFPEVWMVLIRILQSDSVERFESTKQEIRTTTPFKFGGQNIAQMAMLLKKRAGNCSLLGSLNSSCL
jgi:hypothetical protein